MKTILFIIIGCISTFQLTAQVDAFSVLGIPRATNLAELNAITNPNPNVGSMVYNNEDSKIYLYVNDTDRWITLNFDNQNASEVPLVINVDVNTSTTDPTTKRVEETNVEEAIQAIAPITSKAGRVFYPPSIEIDVTTITQPGAPDETINLYQQYVNQYDLNINTTSINGNIVNYQTAKSTSAPNNIPLYNANELYYYVTFADNRVFNITGLSDTGILSYRIVGQPTDFNTLINVVFVVK